MGAIPSGSPSWASPQVTVLVKLLKKRSIGTAKCAGATSVLHHMALPRSQALFSKVVSLIQSCFSCLLASQPVWRRCMIIHTENGDDYHRPSPLAAAHMPMPINVFTHMSTHMSFAGYLHKRLHTYLHRHISTHVYTHVYFTTHMSTHMSFAGDLDERLCRDLGAGRGLR